MAKDAERQALVEAHLGFRIEDQGGSTGPQYQRLSEKGKVIRVRPASATEQQLFDLLCTPEKEWQ